MNTTASNFDFNSFFCFNDAKHFFESFNCKSDEDCPERTPCIGNKCIATFYCKTDDDDKDDNDEKKCSIFTNLCNGKPCYKKFRECSTDDECLGGKCHKIQIYNDTHTYCNNYGCETSHLRDDYYFRNKCGYTKTHIIGQFTLKDAKKYYKQLDISCEVDEDCPDHTYCEHITEYNGKCVSNFLCKDENTCYFTSHFPTYFYDYMSEISKYTYEYGQNHHSKCVFDSDCFKDSCKAFTCGSDEVDGLYYLFFKMFMIIFFCLACCIGTCIVCHYGNRNKKNNHLNK